MIILNFMCLPYIPHKLYYIILKVVYISVYSNIILLSDVVAIFVFVTITHKHETRNTNV